MIALRQMWAVAIMNVRNLPQRAGIILVVGIATAAAVAILVSTIAMMATFQNALRATARLNRAIVLSQLAEGEFDSSLSRTAVLVIADSPGIRRGPNGKAQTSAETTTGVSLPRRDGRRGFLMMRGISADALSVHPEIKLVAGRIFRPAVHEMIVSTRVREQFKDFEVGGHIPLSGGPWEIVGEFDGEGFHDNEVIADPETLMSAYHKNAFQSVLVALESPASFAALKGALTDNPQAPVSVSTEAEYQQKIGGFLLGQLWFVVVGVGGILGLGAVFAALNAMYASTDTRTVEIATLRAIGFDGAAVVASVFAEALVLAFAGGVAGALIAFVSVDHVVIEAGPTTFQIHVTPFILAAGLGLALLIGAIGALFPAIRAARLPVAVALQIR